MLPPDRRARIARIQAEMLDYIDRAANAVDDMERARRGGLPGAGVDRDVYYALLAATTAALDQDDRAREVRTTHLV